MKFKILDELSCSYRDKNEDYIWHDDDTIMLLDGSTNLGLYGDLPDAQWFVKHFSVAFEKSKKNSTDISESLKKAIRILSYEFETVTGISPEKLSATSSASLLLISAIGNNVNLFSLGDCSAIIYFKDNSEPKLIRRNDVSVLDNLVLNKMVSIAHELNINVCDTLTNTIIQDMLKENRKKMNTKDGYWILSFCVEAIDHITQVKFEKEKIDKVLVFSDGFDILTSAFLKEIPRKGLKSYYEELLEIEDSDYSFSKYPRFHLHDDTSAILIDFNY